MLPGAAALKMTLSIKSANYIIHETNELFYLAAVLVVQHAHFSTVTKTLRILVRT